MSNNIAPLSSDRLSQDWSDTSSSKSASSQKSTSIGSNSSGEKISVLPPKKNPPSRFLKKPTNLVSSSSNKVSKISVTKSGKPRAASSNLKTTVATVRKEKSENITLPALETTTEAIPEATPILIYSPSPCVPSDLEKVTLQEYKKFSLSAHTADDDLILFASDTLIASAPQGLPQLSLTATPEEKKIFQEQCNLITENNKIIKAHFEAQLRQHFGDRIADYFILSAIHQAYFKSDALLTVGNVRLLLGKAEEAKTFVTKYSEEHSELPREIAEIMGHAAFLEKEVKTAYEQLEKIGLPKDLLEEIKIQSIEFLKAASVNSAIVAGASAAMIGALSAAFYMTPARLLTTVPATLTLAINRGASTTTTNAARSNDLSSIVLTRSMPVTMIVPVQAAFLHAMYTHSLLLALPLGIGAVGLLASGFALRPGQYLSDALQDCNTPLTKSAALSAQLVQSNALLNETITIQKAAAATYQEAASTYKEAAQIVQENATHDKKTEENILVNTSRVSDSLVKEIAQRGMDHVAVSVNQSIDAFNTSVKQLGELHEKRLKPMSHSPFLTPRGRFKAQF